MKYMVSMRQENRDLKIATGVDEVEARRTFSMWCDDIETNKYPGYISVNIKPMNRTYWDSYLYNCGVRV